MNWEPKHFNFRICALNRYAIFSLIFEKYSQQKHVVSSNENLSNEDTCRNRIFFKNVFSTSIANTLLIGNFPEVAKSMNICVLYKFHICFRFITVIRD